jgi:hypothetical protein
MEFLSEFGTERTIGRNGFAEGAGIEVEWTGECILSDGGQVTRKLVVPSVIEVPTLNPARWRSL